MILVSIMIQGLLASLDLIMFTKKHYEHFMSGWSILKCSHVAKHSTGLNIHII